MKTKVYKVVRTVKEDKAIKYLSAFYKNPFSKEYKVGQAVLPEEGTKLFAFTDIMQAFNYAENMWDSCAVFEAEAENAKPNGWLTTWVKSLASLREMFTLSPDEYATSPKNKEHFITVMKSPENCYNSSVVCDSITLIKQVFTYPENE